MIEESINSDASNVERKKGLNSFLFKEIYPGSLFRLSLDFAIGLITSALFSLLFNILKIIFNPWLAPAPSGGILLLQDLSYIIIFSVLFFTFLHFIKKRKFIGYGLLVGIFVIAWMLITTIYGQLYPVPYDPSQF